MKKTNDNVLNIWCIKNKKKNLLDEWNYNRNGDLIPEAVTYGSEKKVWWKCLKGHEWEAGINSRTRFNVGCPYCSGRNVIEGDNDLKTWCNKNRREELMEEWDYNKNNIDPSKISPHNNMKVWWKCNRGHEWKCTIGSRTSGKPTGCPYCSMPPKRILVGFNDFESWCMKNGKEYLLKEWNIDRNTGVNPREVTYGSGKKVWWKCNRGHEWTVAICKRTRGTGCPVCSRTQTSFPEQAIAYYLSKSFNILQRYRMKGFEIDVYLEDYNIGIEYDGMFYHTKANYKRDKDKDDFYKKLGLRLIRVKENAEKICIENDVVFYIPPKNNYLDDSFNNMLLLLLSYVEKITEIKVERDIDIVRDELLIREHYAAILKNNSVAVVFPELVSEWDVEKNKGMTPDNFSANAHTKIWWKCENGHNWQADISSRNRKLGCPYCAGQKTIKGENDLETWCKNNMPSLLLEWNYDKNTVIPSDISKTSNKKVWWKCSKGHSWESVVANRVNGTRCPYCYTGNNVVRYSVSFAEWCRNNKQEQLLIEWDYKKNGTVTPDSISKGSHKKVWWKCSFGHEWESQVKSRTYNHGCPFCSGTNKKTQVGINDLVTWCKENNKKYILEQWDYELNEGMIPEMFTFGSHKRINWKCSKGHKWNAVIKERTKYKGNMCPECKKE